MVPRTKRWALLLRGLYSWSYRELEEAMRENLVVRWCTHCALQDETPDHTTLCRFEHWVRKQGLEVMFVAVLEQIDEDFPDEARVRQCGDTYGMQANVADVSLTTLLRAANSIPDCLFVAQGTVLTVLPKP